MATKRDAKPGLLIGLLALSLASLPSIADNVPHNDPFPKGLQGNVAHGRAVFEENCMRCHGQHGDGHGPDAAAIEIKPVSFLTESFRNEFGRRDIFTSTALGKLGTHMPTWLKNMNDQDVADVSEYVYQRFVRRQIDPAR